MLRMRKKPPEGPYGYIATADTMTPTLQLLFLVCGIISENDNAVAMSRAMPACHTPLR
jgi:hypothetical protein